MSHIWINESCCTYEWVTLHIWMSHVTCEWVMSLIIQSCLTYKWVTSHNDKSCHASTSHVTHMTETLTCEWVMSHIWMSHVSHMNESRHIISHATGGGDRTYINYDCHNPKQIFTGVPVNFKHVLPGVNGSSRHSKETPGKLGNMQIQRFQVWFPPWAVISEPCLTRIKLKDSPKRAQ